MESLYRGHRFPPEIISHAVWLFHRFIESFNGRLRDECLNVEVFFSIPDAQAKLEQWRVDYNQQRPHSSLGDQTPEAFALAGEGKQRGGTHVSRVSTLEPQRVGVLAAPT